MILKKIFVAVGVGYLLISGGLNYLTDSLYSSGTTPDMFTLGSMGSQVEFTKLSKQSSYYLYHRRRHQNGVRNSSKSKVCSGSFDMSAPATSSMNMLNIYDVLKFDNPDGGAWKQGWNVEVNVSRFSEENKLKVFVVPHSHNDPGWLKTFERYFEEDTRDILTQMLHNLSKNDRMKFIWAEVTFFNLWWNGLTNEEKNEVKRIVATGQLEFVTGGWVMPDESSSHYYSILIQLIEGHQWLFQHLGFTPKNGWSIDPFGMSPTMAYLLSRAGLNNMLIQRTHYAVKKYLAEKQELEFKWRQTWDSDGNTDILCHMMPFYFYDIPHTCGPDPKVCCQFDFKRMNGVSSLFCPWNVAPQPIVARNVHSK